MANPEPVPSSKGGKYKTAWTWLRAAISIWAGFWIVFAVSAHYSDRPIGTKETVQLVLAVLIPVAMSALRRRVGGVLLVLFGIFTAMHFPQPMLRAILSAPAIVFGVLVMVLPRPAKPSAPVVDLLK